MKSIKVCFGTAQEVPESLDLGPGPKSLDLGQLGIPKPMFLYFYQHGLYFFNTLFILFYTFLYFYIVFSFFLVKNYENTLCFCSLHVWAFGRQNEKCENTSCFHTFGPDRILWFLGVNAKNAKTHCVFISFAQTLHRVLTKCHNWLFA